MSQPTLYQILHVAHDADAEQIRTAYRALARQYHPDYNPDDESAEGVFKAITRAYEVLSDPTRRARYDEALAKEHQKSNGGAVNQQPQPQAIGRNETVSLVIFGFFLLLAIAFFFIDTPKGVFFLVIAVGLEIRNSIESVKRRQAQR